MPHSRSASQKPDFRNGLRGQGIYEDKGGPYIRKGHLLGTNAFLLSRRLPLRFRFGTDSYGRQQTEARRCGIVPLMHYNGRIAQDVVLPVDLPILDDLPERAA